jgi:hypothetical protein
LKASLVPEILDSQDPFTLDLAGRRFERGIIPDTGLRKPEVTVGKPMERN